MGEAYLVAFLQVLVDKLARREVFKYFGLIKGVDQKLQKWTATLSAIGAVLNEAEERQLITESKLLKLWLDDLRDLAYDLEDVLDKYATKMLKREVEHYTARRVWNSVPNGVFNYKMNSEIQKITERLQEISQRKDQLSLNIITGTTSSSKARQNLPPSTCQPDGPVIGREEDKRQVVEFLSKQERNAVNFDVVAIVGMAGVGKTTLAAQLFKEIDATEQFKPTAWVCVSDDFNLERVTKQILGAVTSGQCPTEDFIRTLSIFRCYIQFTEADVVLCQNSHQTPIPSSFSRNRCRGIVNSYGSCSFSLQMFCLLLDSSVTPTMVLSSLQKELKPSIATFSSNGS